jgi:hypothetical protein
LLRRIATVALIIGSAAALLIGNSTYAPFFDEAHGSGGVEAGRVQVQVNDSDTPTFAFDTTQECSNMAPGHDCVVPLDVSAGLSTLSATWTTTVSDTDDPEIDCFTVTTSVPSGTAEDDDSDVDHDPGAEFDGELRVSVKDDNACQGATSTITVTVRADQSPTPYN